MNTDDKSRPFLLFSCKLPTYDLVGSSNIVLGVVKVELRFIESCSSKFNFSSGSSLYNDNSSNQYEIASSTYNLGVRCSRTAGIVFTLTNLTLSRFLTWKSTRVVFRIILGSFHLISTYDLVDNSLIVFDNVKQN